VQDPNLRDRPQISQPNYSRLTELSCGKWRLDLSLSTARMAFEFQFTSGIAMDGASTHIFADSIAFRSHATVAANWPTGDGLRSFRRPPRERQLKPRID